MLSKSDIWFFCTFLAAFVLSDSIAQDSISVGHQFQVPDTKYVDGNGASVEVTVEGQMSDQWRLASDSSTAGSVQEVRPDRAVDLGALLDHGYGSGVALVAGDTRLVAHRAVLSARSPVFQRILQDVTVGEVATPGVEGPVLRQMVAYLYTLQAPQLPALAAQLLAAADQYGLPALKADCERQVAAQLTVETAAAAAVVAVRHSSDSLRKAAVDYIRDHIFQVMATQGWADARNSQPQAMAEVDRLLSESTSETGSSAPAESGSSPQHATQPHSDYSGHQTPTTAATTVVAETTTHPDNSSLLRRLSAKEKGERLIEASKRGAVGELEALLAAGADVVARNSGWRNWTALHWAAAEGHEEAARRLLAAGAAVDARSSKLRTPLHEAASQGHAGVVRLLLAAGAAVDARDSVQWTPLHLAARYGHAAVVRLLLDSGAYHSARESDDWTPLHLAARYGNAAVVRLLLDSGAYHSARKGDGWTPLHLAAVNGETEAAAVLIEIGASRAARNDDGRTPLDEARRYNQQEVVELLDSS